MHHQLLLMNALASGSEQTNSVVERDKSKVPPLVLSAPKKSSPNAQDSIWLTFLVEMVLAAGARNPMDKHLIQLHQAQEVMKLAESLLFQNQQMTQPLLMANALVTGLPQITLARAREALVQLTPMQNASTK